MFFSFGGYAVLSNPNAQYDLAKGQRYTDHGMIAYVSDIALLRECDFFVGTLTSNVSQLNQVPNFPNI